MRPSKIKLISASERMWLLLLVFLVPLGCGDHRDETTTCESCHQQIEKVSASHPDCISCHGGNPRDKNKDASHRAMFGPQNPAAPQHWDKTCGACHLYQLGRMKANLMYTATGMIKNTQLTWEGADNQLYSSKGGEVYDYRGKLQRLRPVSGLNNLSGELYRKFCSQCHVAEATGNVYSASHASGCAACHFPYNNTATYEGKDGTVAGKTP